jgi:hypothetical protein
MRGQGEREGTDEREDHGERHRPEELSLDPLEGQDQG